MIKKYTLMTALVMLVFTAGCSSITMKDSCGVMKVDAGDDQTVYVGDTVNFDGYCWVKGGLYQREASWDFGDGSSEDGITATHIYTQPGTYTAELTVSVVFTITIWDTDDCIITVNSLPEESFIPAEGLSAGDTAQAALKNQTAGVLPDGRVVLAGTTEENDPSEIAVAIETTPGSRLFARAACFVQNETDSLPDSVRVLDDENVEISAGGTLFDVCINSGAAASPPGDAS